MFKEGQVRFKLIQQQRLNYNTLYHCNLDFKYRCTMHMLLVCRYQNSKPMPIVSNACKSELKNLPDNKLVRKILLQKNF